MRFLAVSIAALATTVLADGVQVEYTRNVECERKTQAGDKIAVHYRGSLQDGGKEFDASYNRGTPLEFTVGKGQVIKGWDEGLLDMCIGEKRTLTIPPKFGYGDQAMGPIPAGSTLIFETELIGIAGVEPPKNVVEKEASSAASAGTEGASSVASTATEGIKAAVESKIAEAAEAAKVIISDTDGDGQEHNEL